jgi:hypothetical protein
MSLHTAPEGRKMPTMGIHIYLFSSEWCHEKLQGWILISEDGLFDTKNTTRC